MAAPDICYVTWWLHAAMCIIPWCRECSEEPRIPTMTTTCFISTPTQTVFSRFGKSSDISFQLYESFQVGFSILTFSTCRFVILHLFNPKIHKIIFPNLQILMDELQIVIFKFSNFKSSKKNMIKCSKN